MQIDKNYAAFLNTIKSKILSARIRAYRGLNRELIKLYWDLGETIVERQKQHGWGQSIVEKLAKDLQAQFEGREGFSANNLWRIRNFYLAYEKSPKLAQLVQEMPWGHNVVIMQMVKDSIQKEYYISASIKMGWSRNVLLNQIKANAFAYAKQNKKLNNFDKALPTHLADQADESIKSVYSLDFLGITKPVKERELENLLVEKVKRFILELGYGFCFIGNQYRLTLKDNEYFIDLLFYNRKLKSLVAIELKTGKFEPEYAGKMDFYLHLLNDQVKLKDENPPIGIILCADKREVIIEYALGGITNQLFVSKYQLYFPDKEQLQEKINQILDTENQ
jgi:predicted nuclease of restriction endonuclease-like (RecB) superfamily